MRLSDLANGKGAGDARGLTFHRYVLGHHLAEVLEAANARLAAMTLNRYELRVAQGRQATRRVNWGLDIEVMDAHTGEPRAVGTLSGGEGFLASLALALGLADTVQSESAARPLDTIFIDEGFGSLDGGALERAMDALRSLQATGRLVGVVSHVAEMREEIDAVLEVTNDGRGRGSRTRLVLR
jgi:exonuclease SbcC